MKAKLALVLNPLVDENLKRARQIGVTDIVGGLPPEHRGPVWELLPLLLLRKRVEDAGLNLTVLEGPPPMQKTTLGLPGRDEEIENFCQSLRNIGRASIPSCATTSWQGTTGCERPPPLAPEAAPG